MELIEAIKIASKEAGQFIKEELYKVQDSDIEEKELNSLVSYVDKQAEQIIIKRLETDSEINANFITEENTYDGGVINSDFSFVIDPLDGTTNFLKKIPHFSVSIALEKNKTPIIGVVYDIMQDDLYFAEVNKGAFVNDRKIQCSQITQLEKAIIATGFPYINIDYSKKFKVLQYWLENSRGMRRMGSAALDLVYVASGKLDVYYESHLNRWDLSAGALIAKEAGATVADFIGNHSYLESGNIIASNPFLFDKVLEVISGYR